MATEISPERLREIENADDAAEDIVRLGCTSRRCLMCGGELALEQRPGAYLVRCVTEDRIIVAGRGL